MPPPGRVVLVGTPIGNLGDLAPRAVEVLRGADVICCEDTRHTRKLLTAAGVHGPRLVAMHQHNEAAVSEQAVRWAAEGSTVAVVTDAGMPGISDPGERVVRAAVAAGVPVSVIPGPSAAVAALAVSGLATGRFCFEGFLPRSGGSRRARLAALAGEARTAVLYEAPHRVARTVTELVAVCGPDRPVVLARELTKVHEEVWRGTLGQAVDWLADRAPRGEWVLVLGGSAPAEADEAEVVAALERRLAAGATRRGAVDAVVAELGVPRAVAYRLALGLAAGPGDGPVAP